MTLVNRSTMIPTLISMDSKPEQLE